MIISGWSHKPMNEPVKQPMKLPEVKAIVKEQQGEL